MSELPEPAHFLHYRTTRWTSVIESARHEEPGKAHAALTIFCEEYRDIIYRFFLRKFGPDKAENYTQEFFLKKIQQPWSKQEGLLFKVNRGDGGRFRYYLTNALTWFIRDQEKAARDPLKDAVSEVPDSSNSAESESIVQACDQEVAFGLVRRLMDRLRISNVYLKFFCEQISVEEGAKELGMSHGAFRVAVHRLVPKIRDAFKEEGPGNCKFRGRGWGRNAAPHQNRCRRP